jgi:DNA-binding NarL/FixJ family response regulator
LKSETLISTFFEESDMTITIVLADDHGLVREGLSLLLETQKDLEVIGEAENGREAVALIKEICPDVAILDIAMPELNGIEAARQIRDNCSRTRVIIFSMYAASKHVFYALRAGVHGYLLKESSMTELVTAIHMVYQGRRYLSQKISDKIIDDYLNQQKATEDTDLLGLLSPREREVLQLVVEGKSSAQIADILFLSPKTVETYRGRLMQKLNLSSLPGLVKFAIQHGLTPLEV